jgi:hypothetical protein
MYAKMNKLLPLHVQARSEYDIISSIAEYSRRLFRSYIAFFVINCAHYHLQDSIFELLHTRVLACWRWVQTILSVDKHGHSLSCHLVVTSSSSIMSSCLIPVPHPLCFLGYQVTLPSSLPSSLTPPHWPVWITVLAAWESEPRTAGNVCEMGKVE